jgi:hypothetical protein
MTTNASEKRGSGQLDHWKQLCPLVLQATPKDPIYGVQQLSRNRDKRPVDGPSFELAGFRKKPLRGDRNEMRQAPACKALFLGDDFQHG